MASSHTYNKENGIKTLKSEDKAKAFCAKWGLAQSSSPGVIGGGLYGSPIPITDQSAFPKICVRDLFHDVLAGTLQSVVRASLEMSEALSDPNNIVNPWKCGVDVMEVINFRTSSVMTPSVSMVPKQSHMDWASFEEGVCGIVFKHNKKTGATGKAGQRRSNLVIAYSLMIVMAIGPWGELIDNGFDPDRPEEQRGDQHETTFVAALNMKPKVVDAGEHPLIVLPNPTETIVRANLATLSYWFEMNRDSWSQRLCDKNVQLIRAMQAYDALLYQNMTAISRWKEKPKKKVQDESTKKAEGEIVAEKEKAGIVPDAGMVPNGDSEDKGLMQPVGQSLAPDMLTKNKEQQIRLGLRSFHCMISGKKRL